MGGRIDIETDDVPELLDKLRVLRQFERPDTVRRELVSFQDALHRTQAHSGRLGKFPARPVGRPAAAPRPDRPPAERCWAAAGAYQACASCRATALRRPPPMNRACQVPTTGFDLPDRRMISAVPQPSAVARITLARHTCFCGALRSATIASSRRRSARVTLTTIPALIMRAWTASADLGIVRINQTTRTHRRQLERDIHPTSATARPCGGDDTKMLFLSG